ncbi:MAG TPA: hypothetical protein VF640_05645, partial [Acidimicrobiales bacterium]
MEALLEGLLAGYGIAVPVGAVAVVFVGAAARHGRRAGMAAVDDVPSRVAPAATMASASSAVRMPPDALTPSRPPTVAAIN